MNVLKGMFSKFLKHKNHSISLSRKYIFYRIIDFNKRKLKEEYVLQCISKKSTFRSSLLEIIFDKDILYGLHPIQACFVGIEYSKELKKYHHSLIRYPKLKKNPKKTPELLQRYGHYQYLFQGRSGDITFLDLATGEKLKAHPREIVLKKEAIEKFDASQAFHIGLSYGLKSGYSEREKPYSNIIPYSSAFN